MRKVLFVATVESHIVRFHIPFIRYLQNRGYEIHVATNLEKKRSKSEKEGIKFHNIDISRKPHSLRNFIALRQLTCLMKEHNFKLLHFHTPVGGVLGRIAAKLSNSKSVIYTAHGFHFYKGAPLKNWIIYYPIERLLARWTDAIITINEEDFNCAKKFKLRKKGNVYKTHGVGVNIHKYSGNNMGSRKEYRKHLGIPQDAVVISCIAELNKNKNQIQLIDAIKEIILEDKNVYLLLVGQGENYDELEKEISQNQLNNNIRLLGFRRDIPDILNATDIMALVSIREGLPKCLLEGMSFGLPILASNIRGSRELVNNGINGFLVPINNTKATKSALTQLIKDPILRKKFGEYNKNKVKEYSIDTVIEEVSNIYCDILMETQSNDTKTNWVKV